MKTQIWIAISLYVLVAIVEKELRVKRSLYEILQVLSLTLFEKHRFYMHFRPKPTHPSRTPIVTS